MRTLRERAHIRFLGWRAERAGRKLRSKSWLPLDAPLADRLEEGNRISQSREYAPIRAYHMATRHKIKFVADPDIPNWGTTTCLTCGATARSDGHVCPCGGCGQCDRCYGVT